MRPHTKRFTKEAGNILFLILLAVVLFAALSYAVTQSMRGGGKDGGGEKVTAQAGELLNYFTQVDTAVQRMMVVNNIQDYQLNFFYQVGSNYVLGSNDNTNCTESRCRVFDPAGGAVSGKKFAGYIGNSGTNALGYQRIMLFTVPGAGTSKSDLLMTIYNVKPEICQEINKKVGLDDIIFNVPALTESASTLFYHNAQPAGTFPDTTLTLNVTPQVGSLGTFCACSQATASACTGFSPILYHVLVAR